MKVLGINGSARKDDNTAILINKAFEELEAVGIETELIQFSGQVIEPCKVCCWACGGQKNCVQKKDMFHETFEKMTQADGIILASSLYSTDVSASMQVFLEKAAVVSGMNQGLMKHKVGASLTSGISTEIDVMNHFFMTQKVFMVGSSYWSTTCDQIPDDILKNEEKLNTMKNLGQNMGYLLKKLERKESK